MLAVAALLLTASASVSAVPVADPPYQGYSAHYRASDDDGLRFKIFGGSVLPKPVPYMAQVYNVIAENESLQCGGTLISPTQVSIALNLSFLSMINTGLASTSEDILG
jgi:hypothetical protein